MKHNKICKLLLLTTIFGMLTACGGGNSSVVPSSQSSQQSQQSEHSVPSSGSSSSIISISSKDSSSSISSSKQEEVLHGTIIHDPVGTIQVDESITVSALYERGDGDPTDLSKYHYSWVAADSSVISLIPNNNECIIKGLKVGSSKLTISFGNISAETTVTVKEKYVEVTSVTLSEKALNFTVGDASKTLTATVLPKDATIKDVIWSSSAAGIASVNNGVVTAIAAGNAVITATCDGKSDTCDVTVVNPPVVYDYQAVINGVNIPLTKNESASGQGLVAEYQAKNVAVTEGQSVKFIDKDNKELTKDFGAEPDSETQHNNVRQNEGAYTIRDSGTVDIYLKIWETPYTNFWITGGGIIRTEPHWCIHYYEALTQKWSDMEMTYLEDDDEYSLTIDMKAGDKACYWNGMEGDKQEWLHADSLMSEQLIGFEVDTDKNIVCKHPGQYEFQVDFDRSEEETNTRLYDHSYTCFINNLKYNPMNPVYSNKYMMLEVEESEELVKDAILSFERNGVVIPTDNIIVEKDANAYVDNGVIKVKENPGEEECGVYLRTDNLDNKYILWVGEYRSPRPLTIWKLQYSTDGINWNYYEMTPISENSTEYCLKGENAITVDTNTQFYIWNNQEGSYATYYNFDSIKYDDSLLVTKEGNNWKFNDAGEYEIYVETDPEFEGNGRIGFNNVSYSIKQGEGDVQNLSMKLTREGEPEVNRIEYFLTNNALKAGDVLEFYKDGTKIDNSLISIKTCANAEKVEGVIKVVSDFAATEHKGIYLEKTNDGYALWVDSEPGWYVHYYETATQKWSNLKMSYDDEYYYLDKEMAVGDKFCFWGLSEDGTQTWVNSDEITPEELIPFNVDDNTVVCKYPGKYGFSIIEEDESEIVPTIFDLTHSINVGDTKYENVDSVHYNGYIQYYKPSLTSLTADTIITLEKNGVAIPTSRITIEDGANAYVDGDVIRINNSASGSTYGVYFKSLDLEQNYLLYIDAYEAVEKWVVHFYDASEDKWSNIDMSQMGETSEYQLENQIFETGDKFCIWNGIKVAEDVVWLHYVNVKYDDQLLVSYDEDGNIIFNDPAKYSIYVDIEAETIGLCNNSYSAKVNASTSNLSMKLDRTSEDPKEGVIEYSLTNKELKAGDVLEFYKDGNKIPADQITIKSGKNNAFVGGGVIYVINDFEATENKGIYLEKTSEGYALWVDGFAEVENWVVHFYDASETKWSDIEMTQIGETSEYQLENQTFEAGDKFCIWNSIMAEEEAVWLHYVNVKYDDQLLVYYDTDGNITFNDPAKYSIYVDIEAETIGLCNNSYSAKVNADQSNLSMKLNRTSEDPKEGVIEYCLTNKTLFAGDVLEFYKDGVKISADKITIKSGKNNCVKTEGVITVHNDHAATEEEGIFLEKVSEGYALWVSGYEDEPVYNYALHGKVNGSVEWKDYEMTQNTEKGKEAEYLLKDVVMKAGDEFCFKYNGDTWYKYDDIKEGCLDLFTEGATDNNIVIKDDGVYNFYVGLEDDKGNFIWASRRDYVAFYLMDGEDEVQDTLAFDDTDNTYYSGLDLYGTTTEYYLWNGLTGEDSVTYYYDDIFEPCQQHLNVVGEGEDKLFKFKLDGQYSFVISSDYKARVFNDSLYMKINGETTVKLDPGHTNTYWYAQFEEYGLNAGTKLEFFYCDSKIDPASITLEEDCNAVVEDGYFKLINDFDVEENNLIKLTVNSGYSLMIDGKETPAITTYGYTINDGDMHELTEGKTNEWVDEDVVLTPNDTIAFYDCRGETPVLIPVALETGSSTNFRINDDKLVSYWGGTFDLYLKLEFENDKVYVEGEVTTPAITYTLHYGDPIPVEFKDGQWSITEIELDTYEVLELFADGEPYPFILESGCTVTGLDIDGSKATSTVDDCTFSFYVKESGLTWINRNYPSVTIKLNVDTFTDWKNDNAWFAAYVYTEEAEDGHFEYLNSDLELETTTQYQYFSFVRMCPNTNPSYDSSNGGLNWNNKWNQTPDQSFSLSDDGETYNVTNWNSGSWQS